MYTREEEVKQKSKIKQNADKKLNKIALLRAWLSVWALSLFPLNFQLFAKHESYNKIFHFKYSQNIFSVFSPILLPCCQTKFSKYNSCVP